MWIARTSADRPMHRGRECARGSGAPELAWRSWHEPLDAGDENSFGIERLELGNGTIDLRGRHYCVNGDMLAAVHDVDHRWAVESRQHALHRRQAGTRHVGHEVALPARPQDRLERT